MARPGDPIIVDPNPLRLPVRRPARRREYPFPELARGFGEVLLWRYRQAAQAVTR